MIDAPTAIHSLMQRPPTVSTRKEFPLPLPFRRTRRPLGNNSFSLLTAPPACIIIIHVRSLAAQESRLLAFDTRVRVMGSDFRARSSKLTAVFPVQQKAGFVPAFCFISPLDSPARVYYNNPREKSRCTRIAASCVCVRVAAAASGRVACLGRSISGAQKSRVRPCFFVFISP